MPPELTTDSLVLLLRAALLLVLYGFLVLVFLAVRRELYQQLGERPAVFGRLIVLEAGATGLPSGHALPLQVVTTLGRSPNCTVVLTDTFVSGTHAILTWRDGRWWVRDAGSTNGTLLNQRVLPEEETAVEYDDVLGIGRLRLRLSPP